jgi:hypothetical protein
MKVVIVVGLSIFLAYAAADAFKLGWDDTDGETKRSGMRLFTDYRTGCQYLGGAWGGITPRVNRDGTHMCDTNNERS